MYNRNSYYLEGGSAWFSHVAAEIEQQRYALSPQDFKRYKLDLLLRVARRVDDFSQTCSECQAYRDEITRLLGELSLLFHLPGKEGREGIKKYSADVKGMVEHLKKTHKLVDRRQYLSLGISIGTGAGAALGGALNQLSGYAGLGTVIGILLGLGIGWYLDRRAENEGRVI
jgi:hypothetical protein